MDTFNRHRTLADNPLNNTPESFLSLRKPSNDDDEVFIKSINYPYQAAKLRSASPSKNANQFHSPVKFSWKAFWKTFIYENLPPVFLSPIAAIILEKSLSRAWHVIQNRGLCAVSTKHHPLSSIIQSWLLVYPGSWAMTIGLYLVLFSEPEAIRNIDSFLMVLAYLLLFMRRLIISIKYGYFREEDLERLCLPAPDWDNNKTVRRLIGQGWLYPQNFPGLIEDEMTVAMDENDLCLQGMPVALNQEGANTFSEVTCSPLFPAKTSVTGKNYVSSGFTLHTIIKAIYHKPLSKNLRWITLGAVLAMTIIPFFVKYLYGVPLFGVTSTEIFISAITLIGFLNGVQLVLFGMICATDYERRYQTMKKLGELVKYPGLNSAFLNTSFKETADKVSFVFIDLHKRSNVFAWMNMRKVLRSFGESYYYRIQGYTSILVAYSLFSIGLLNVIFWVELRHHISTIYIITTIILLVSSISLYAIYKAIKLQSLSAEHRDFVRNELFIIEEEIWELKLTDISHERITDLQAAKALLQQVDESINYKELIYKPTTILGFAANNGVIGTIFGLVISGCLFAIQGFVSRGISYDVLGWFNF